MIEQLPQIINAVASLYFIQINVGSLQGYIDRMRDVSNYLFGSLEGLSQEVGCLERVGRGLCEIFCKKSILTYSILGLVIRFVISPFFGHPYDTRIFMAVGWAVAEGVTPYGRYVLDEVFLDMPHPHLSGSFYGIGYPPSWGLILGFMYRLASMINPNDILTLVLFLKVPIIIGDLAASLAIYKILERELSEDTAFKAFRLYQLCPFSIIIGAVWGMFDVLVFLLTILSAYLLLERVGLSLTLLAFACSLKPYPIVLAPLFSIFIYKRTDSLRMACDYTLGVTALLSLITIIPMAVYNWPLSNLYHALASHMSSTILFYNGQVNYTFGAASPFNIYNIFKLIDPAVNPPWTLNYLWIAGVAASYYYAARYVKEVNLHSILNWSFLVSLTFFTTRFWVSEQNLIHLFSLFLLVVLLNRTGGGWKYIHALWILLFAFVLIHVPVTAFLWITDPSSLNADLILNAGPLRWFLMSGFTLSWLAILWRYSFKRVMDW